MLRKNGIIGTIVAVAAALAVAFALAGCSGGAGNENTAPNREAKFVGVWKIQSMEDPDQGNLDEILEWLRSAGAELSVVFYDDADHTVKINILASTNDQLSGNWEIVDDNTVKVTVDGASQNAVISSDGMLVMEQDGNKLVCEKSSDDPHDSIVEDTAGAYGNSSASATK